MTNETTSLADCLDNVNANNLSRLLDTMNINYSLFDVKGNYIDQNLSMTETITKGKTTASDIDNPSWQHCQNIMNVGKPLIIDEPFKEKTANYEKGSMVRFR